MNFKEWHCAHYYYDKFQLSILNVFLYFSQYDRDSNSCWSPNNPESLNVTFRPTLKFAVPCHDVIRWGLTVSASATSSKNLSHLHLLTTSAQCIPYLNFWTSVCPPESNLQFLFCKSNIAFEKNSSHWFTFYWLRRKLYRKIRITKLWANTYLDYLSIFFLCNTPLMNLH